MYISRNGVSSSLQTKKSSPSGNTAASEAYKRSVSTKTSNVKTTTSVTKLPSSGTSASPASTANVSNKSKTTVEVVKPSGNTAAAEAYKKVVSTKTNKKVSSTATSTNTKKSTNAKVISTSKAKSKVKASSGVSSSSQPKKSSGNTAAEEAYKRSVSTKTNNKVSSTTASTNTKKSTNATVMSTSKAKSKVKSSPISTTSAIKVKKVSSTKTTNAIAELETKKGKSALRDKQSTSTGNSTANIEAKKGIQQRDNKNKPSTNSVKLKEYGLDTQTIKDKVKIPNDTSCYVKSVEENKNGSAVIKIGLANGKTASITVSKQTQRTSKTENGKVVVSEIKGAKINSITLPSGNVVSLDFSKKSKQKIKEDMKIGNNSEILGYSDVTVNGQKIRLYYAGDTNLLQMDDSAKAMEIGLSGFSDKALKKVTENPNFMGYVVGNFEDTVGYSNLRKSYPKEFIENHAKGVAYGEYEVYINNKSIGDKTASTIAHETGHIIDYSNGNKKYGENQTKHDETFQKLYNKHKKTFQQAFAGEIGYGAEGFADGIPNETEMYAVASEAYATNKKKLQKLFPDLFLYMENTYNQ